MGKNPATGIEEVNSPKRSSNQTEEERNEKNPFPDNPTAEDPKENDLINDPKAPDHTPPVSSYSDDEENPEVEKSESDNEEEEE